MARTTTRRRAARAEGVQTPMQPVDEPILCSPYKEPCEYWFYDRQTGEPSRAPGRRPAGYWFRNERTSDEQQGRLFAEENFVPLDYVNSLREDVKRWRDSGYRNATNTTRKLLRHWWRDDLTRRLFFCQLEAVETIIYLAEIRMGGKRTSFRPAFSDDDLARLVDVPFDPRLPPLTRMGCKMATGSGKTVVMAMLIAWAFCNRGQMPSDERFPSAVLVVCPNLTIRERLQVLRPDNPASYYTEFDLVPTQMRRYLQGGEVLITNWHRFAPESEHSEGGRSYAVVNKGEESADAFSRRVLGDLYGRGPVMVLNDEGHHAYRPGNVDAKGLSAEERREANGSERGGDRLDTGPRPHQPVERGEVLRRPVRDALLQQGQRPRRGRAVPLAGERLQPRGRHRVGHRQDSPPAGRRHDRQAGAALLSAVEVDRRRPAARSAAARPRQQAEARSDMGEGGASVADAGGPVQGAVRVHTRRVARAGQDSACADRRVRQHGHRRAVFPEHIGRVQGAGNRRRRQDIEARARQAKDEDRVRRRTGPSRVLQQRGPDANAPDRLEAAGRGGVRQGRAKRRRMGPRSCGESSTPWASPASRASR